MSPIKNIAVDSLSEVLQKKTLSNTYLLTIQLEYLASYVTTMSSNSVELANKLLLCLFRYENLLLCPFRGMVSHSTHSREPGAISSDDEGIERISHQRTRAVRKPHRLQRLSPKWKDLG